MQCWTCGGWGHTAAECPTGKGKGKGKGKAKGKSSGKGAYEVEVQEWPHEEETETQENHGFGETGINEIIGWTAVQGRPNRTTENKKKVGKSD